MCSIGPSVASSNVEQMCTTSRRAVDQLFPDQTVVNVVREIIQQDQSVILDEILRCLPRNIEASLATDGIIVSNDLHY